MALEPQCAYAVAAHYGLDDGIVKSFEEISQVLGKTVDQAKYLVRKSITELRKGKLKDWFTDV